MNFRTFTVGLLVGGAALFGANYYNNKNKADATNIPQELRLEYERIKTALQNKIASSKDTIYLDNNLKPIYPDSTINHVAEFTNGTKDTIRYNLEQLNTVPGVYFERYDRNLHFAPNVNKITKDLAIKAYEQIKRIK